MSNKHEFLLANLETYKEIVDNNNFINKSIKTVKICDELLMFMSPTIKWIPEVQYPNGEKGEGIDYYAYNLLGKISAIHFRKILISWIDLFTNAPDEFSIGEKHYCPAIKDENGKILEEEWSEALLIFKKHQVIKSLKKIVAFANRVIEEDDLYIIHLGI